MTRERRTFALEFKREAVRLVQESGRSVAAIARELRLRPDLLRSWRRQLEAEGAAPPPVGTEAPEEEVRRLRRELEVVRQERDFLKKAAAFFAKGSA
jgi:transposase